MIIPLSIAAMLNILLAYYDSYRMKENRRIQHGVNALIYAAICVCIALVYGNVWYALPMILIRPIIFDPVLNMFNQKNPFHVSLTTTSIIDKWERKVLGNNGFVHWLVAVGLFIISVLLIWLL